MGGSNAHPVLELNQQRPVFRNYRLLMNGTLFISKASENDEGKFICEADNGVNEPIGKMVTLKINGKKNQLLSTQAKGQRPKPLRMKTTISSLSLWRDFSFFNISFFLSAKIIDIFILFGLFSRVKSKPTNQCSSFCFDFKTENLTGIF